MGCWNDVGHIRLTGSQAWLACSYFAKVQPCGLDFTHWNQTQENTYRLLLSSFVHFLVWVRVNGLTFVIRNFRPYLSEFVSQHIATAVWQQKSNAEKKVKANPVYEKEKTNRKWQDSWRWAASGEERLWLTNDEAKSGIGDHRTSLNAQPSSLRELRTMKGPLCMNTASRLRRQRRDQAKLMEPDLRSNLHNNRERRWFFRTANALAIKVGPHSDFK